MNFKERLRAALRNFNKQEAEKLHAELQEAEQNGYSVSAREDMLWTELTIKILMPPKE